MTHSHTLNACAAWAARMTKDAAAVKAWRLTNKKDRAAHAAAVELAAGRGYLIATPRELYTRYEFSRPLFWESSPDVDKKMLWGIHWMPERNGRRSLSFVPVYIG